MVNVQFLFTEFVPLAETRYLIGWYFISLWTLYFVVAIGNLALKSLM